MRLPKDVQFIGTYFIYLARMNVVPKKKVSLAKAILLPQQPLHRLFNCFHNTHEWSSSSAELGWLMDFCSEKGSKKGNEYLLRKLCRLVDARLYEGKPIQYILGTHYFNDMLLYVEKPILIPRWETEEWCEWLLNRIKQRSELTILEFGSGSGCISLYLAKYLKDVKVYSIDYNENAVKLSNKNKKFHKLKNVEFLQGDLFSDLSVLHKLEGKVDIIVSNPPYICDSDRPNIDNSVLGWEDEKALFSPNYGSAHQIRIIEISKKFLRNKNESKRILHEKEEATNENEREHRKERETEKERENEKESALGYAIRIIMELDGNQKQIDLVKTCADLHGYNTLFQKDTADKMRWVTCTSKE